MTDLPAAVTFGKVVGRFLLAVGDSDDAGSNPDARAGSGSILFTPRPANKRVASASVPEWVTVTNRPPLCTLDADGFLVDAQGNQGVWLAVGVYDVTFRLKDTRILPITIEVTADHATTPLDLSVAIPVEGGAQLGDTQYAELSDRINALLINGGDGLTAQQVRDILYAALDMGTGIHIQSFDPSSVTIRTWHGFRGVFSGPLYYWVGDHVIHAGGLWRALVDGDNLSSPGADPLVWESIPLTGGLDAEAVRDLMGTALVAGSNVTITPNDPGDTITIAATVPAGYTDEQVRDVMGTALVAGANVTITPNDGSDTITIAATVPAAYTDEQVRDVMGSALVAGSNVTITPNDPGDTITISATAPDPNASAQTIDAKTASYTLVAGDVGKLITMNSTSAMNINIPTDANMVWAVGARVDILVLNTGMVTAVAVTPGTTAVNGTPSLVSRARYSMFSLVKIGSNSWIAVGDLA